MGSSPDPDKYDFSKSIKGYIKFTKHMDLVFLIPLFFLLEVLFNKITSVRVENVYQNSYFITNETSILIYDGIPLYKNFTDDNFTLAENESLTLTDTESFTLAGNELSLSLAENESYFMATNDSQTALSLSGHLLDLHIVPCIFIYFILSLMLIILSPRKRFWMIFPIYVIFSVIAFILLAYPPLIRFHLSFTNPIQILLLRFFFFSIISLAFFLQIESKHRTRGVQFAIHLYLLLSTISPYTAAALEFSIAKYILIAFLVSLSAKGITLHPVSCKNITVLLLVLLTFAFIHTLLLYFRAIIVDNEYVNNNWEDVWRKNFHDFGFASQRIILLLSLSFIFYCMCSEMMGMCMEKRAFTYSSRATFALPPILFFIFTVDREVWHLTDKFSFYIVAYLQSYFIAVLANCCQRVGLRLPWKLKLKREKKLGRIDIQLNKVDNCSGTILLFIFSLSIFCIMTCFYVTYSLFFFFIFVVYLLPVSLIYKKISGGLCQNEKTREAHWWSSSKRDEYREERYRNKKEERALAKRVFMMAKCLREELHYYNEESKARAWRSYERDKDELKRRRKERAEKEQEWRTFKKNKKAERMKHARKHLVKIINGVYLARNVEYLLRIFLFFSLSLSMWAIFVFRLTCHLSLDLQSLIGGIYYADLLKRFLTNKERSAAFMKFLKVVRRVNSMNRSSWFRDYVSAECSICNEAVNNRNRYVMTPCNHHFHKRCLLAHLLTSNKCHKCKTIVASVRKPIDPINTA